MANYTLIANSQFKPFTYQDFLAPALMATQAHQELENQYSELSTKANVWENLANEQTDPNAYKMYKTYADDLNTQAEQLAREGLNVTSRKNMLNMRNRYSKEIVPIEQAYKRREELAAEQRKAALSNPTMFYQRNASTISLDDFIKNPSLDYGKSYSGALLAQQVGQMATNLKTALTGKSRLKGIGLPYQYEQLLQYGYTPQQIQEAITNPQSGNPVLNTIVEQALNASGMKEWASPQQLREAIAYANQGLYNAIGKSEIKNFKDDFSMQNALDRIRAARAQQAQQAQQKGGFQLNPSNIYSSREKTKEEQEFENNKKRFSQYFYKDAQGRTKLTYAGWKEYHRKIYDNVGSVTISSTTGTSWSNPGSGQRLSSEFKDFIDSLGGRKYMGTGTTNKNGKIDYHPGEVGNLWAKYTSSPTATSARFDAMKTTEYIYDVPQSQEYQRNYKAKLSRAIGSTGDLTEVDYDSKNNKWESIGKLSFSDFDTDDYTLVARAPSEIGTTLFILKKGDKKAKRYLAPSGVNTTMEGGRDQAITEMLNTQRMLQNPNLTPQQRLKLENHYDNLSQQQMMFESGLDLTNTTETQKYPNYYIP